MQPTRPTNNYDEGEGAKWGLKLRIFPNPRKCVHRKTPLLYRKGTILCPWKEKKEERDAFEGIGGKSTRGIDHPYTYVPGFDGTIPPPISSPLRR